MKWLTSDYSDFYIEEENSFNPCGEFIKTLYYVRYADYNIFGRKKYIRYYQVSYYSYENIVSNELCWNTKEKALEYWKTKTHTTKSITHKIDCNE
jgi:hypothetical protein